MNNLKRVLSLVLALVMIVGVMAVASATEFTDQAEITHTEAVDTMNALGVILGKDDGSYDPTANITRGEMSTIIARILNSGKLPAVGSGSALHFTDIETHWARNYIEYCANLGIVNGRGDGTFDPNADVTFAEAAKMLLVAAGYEADIFGLTGRDWELTTNSYANRLGLYAELGNPDTSKPLNRDNAAQMSFNALNLKTVNPVRTATSNGTEIQYQENSETVLAKYFGADTKYAYLTGATYDATKKLYTYTFSATSTTFGESNAIPSGDRFSVASKATSDKDFSHLFGQKVAVIYKGSGSSLTLFGLSGKGTTLFEGAKADVSLSENLKTLTYAKADYVFDAEGTGKYVAFNDTTVKAAADVKAYETVKAIDNDDDGAIDVVVYNPVTVGKVDYVGSTNFYLEGQATVKKADVTVYDGMAKGDWVTVTVDLNGDAIYTKIAEADIITGTVTATNGTRAQIDGTYYDLKTADNTSDYGTEADVKANALKNDLTLVLVNGKVAAIEKVAGTTAATVFGVVLKTAEGTSALNETAQVRVLQEGGTTADLDVTSISGLKAGDMVTIKTASGGKYTLTKVADADINGYTKLGSLGIDYEKDTIGGSTYTIADDAVVFVQDSDGDYSVITGAALKKYADKSVENDTAEAAFVKTNNTTKFEQVAVAYVKLTKTASLSNKVYGWVTSTVTNTKDGSVVDVYTTDGLKEGITVSSSDYDLTRDAIIILTENSDGKTYSAQVQTTDAVAVTKYDSTSGKIELTKTDGTTVDTSVTSSTKVLFIDSANHADSEGSIKLATTKRNEAQKPVVVVNAVAVLDGTTLNALFVDTANTVSNTLGGAEIAVQ